MANAASLERGGPGVRPAAGLRRGDAHQGRHHLRRVRLRLLSGSALAGGFILGAFGAARSVLPVVLVPWVASPKSALSFALRLDDYAGRVGTLNGLVLLAAGGILAGLAWHALGCLRLP